MISLRSLFPIALVTLSAGAAVGCKEETPAKPDPAAATSASAGGKGKLSLRSPVAPTPKVDPQVMKEYRADVCYFGSLSLKQARDAYLGSLGNAAPSEKKLPSFGGAHSPTMPATAPGGSAGPAARPKASGAPSAGPAGMLPDPTRRPFDMAMRAPHERNARACTAAASLKDPAMPAVDAAIGEFAPYAVELAKNIAAAQAYYQREEFKKDKFEKGQELHKKLTEDFKKLDDMSAKVGDAIAAWRKEHPADTSKMEEGQKTALAAFEEARGVMIALVGAKKPDPAAFKEALGKLEKSIEAVKTFAAGHAADPWPKIMTPAFEGFLKASKEAGDKLTDKGLEPDAFLTMVTSFTSVIEAKHRALTRSLVTRPQLVPANVPAPTGAASAEQPH